MSDGILRQRERALEEAFFAAHNNALLQKIRDAEATVSRKAALSAAAGITDDALLDQLVTLNLEPQTMAALACVPLVLVAWADGSLDAREKQAVLDGAREAGLQDKDAAWQLLAGWLHSAPAPALEDAWRSYVKTLTAALPPAEQATLKRGILDRTRRVAEAAGGFLGIGGISPVEKAVLTRLEQAFAS